MMAAAHRGNDIPVYQMEPLVDTAIEKMGAIGIGPSIADKQSYFTVRNCRNNPLTGVGR